MSYIHRKYNNLYCISRTKHIIYIFTFLIFVFVPYNLYLSCYFYYTNSSSAPAALRNTGCLRSHKLHQGSKRDKDERNVRDWRHPPYLIEESLLCLSSEVNIHFVRSSRVKRERNETFAGRAMYRTGSSRAHRKGGKKKKRRGNEDRVENLGRRIQRLSGSIGQRRVLFGVRSRVQEFAWKSINLGRSPVYARPFLVVVQPLSTDRVLVSSVFTHPFSPRLHPRTL